MIAASAAGSRCSADSACSEPIEQQNVDSLSGTSQLLCFVIQLGHQMFPGYKSFSNKSGCNGTLNSLLL